MKTNVILNNNVLNDLYELRLFLSCVYHVADLALILKLQTNEQTNERMNEVTK